LRLVLNSLRVKGKVSVQLFAFAYMDRLSPGFFYGGKAAEYLKKSICLALLRKALIMFMGK